MLLGPEWEPGGYLTTTKALPSVLVGLFVLSIGYIMHKRPTLNGWSAVGAGYVRVRRPRIRLLSPLSLSVALLWPGVEKLSLAGPGSGIP